MKTFQWLNDNISTTNRISFWFTACLGHVERRAKSAVLLLLGVQRATGWQSWEAKRRSAKAKRIGRKEEAGEGREKGLQKFLSSEIDAYVVLLLQYDIIILMTKVGVSNGNIKGQFF